MSEGANHGKQYHHGRTPAAWTGSTIALIGFLISAVGFLMSMNWVLFWIGIVVVLAGAVVGGVMHKMGLGQA